MDAKARPVDRPLPRLQKGLARIASLRVLNGSSVTLQTADGPLVVEATRAQLDLAGRRLYDEFEFVVLLEGDAARLLRLDPLPEGRPRASYGEAGARAAERWSEVLERLGQGPA